MRHGGRPGRRRVKDDNGGDEFRVCGMQPVPHPVVCTAPSCATTPPPPSTRRHHLLHAAATLYTPPPLPSLCHPRCPYVPSLVSPLAAASTCSAALVHGLRAHATCSPGPSGHTLPSHTSRPRPHLSHGPMHHPSDCPLCTPHVSAPSLAPSVAVPRILAPIACALASRAPSAAVPHVSAPVACTLASWAPSMAMRRDHAAVFVSCSCATGWHTRVGRAWETVHTL